LARYSLHPVHHAPPDQGAVRQLHARLDFVKVPVQAAADSSSLADQVLAVVEKQLDLSSLALQAGDRKVRLAQCSAGHGQGIDGVGLPKLSSGDTNRRHESRLDQDHRFASVEQVRFQSPRQVSTVL